MLPTEIDAYLDVCIAQHDPVVGLIGTSRLYVPIKPANAAYNTPVLTL